MLRHILMLWREAGRDFNDQLLDIHTTPNIIRAIKPRTMTWAGDVARMGEMRNVYTIVAGKPEGKIPLGRPRHRWEINIETDLRKIEWRGVDWIHLAQDRDQ
jgi:hypothetical protein